MEEIYTNLCENKKIYTDDELILSISQNYNERELLYLEDGYGEKLVSLIAKRYGMNIIYKIHEYYKKNNNTSINEILFKKQIYEDCIMDIWNLTYHPLSECYNITGIVGCFEMIDKIYDKNFNLLFDLSEYQECSNIVVGIFDQVSYHDPYINDFLNLLLKYNVNYSQFNYTKLIKICYDNWNDSSHILKWLLEHNIYKKNY